MTPRFMVERGEIVQARRHVAVEIGRSVVRRIGVVPRKRQLPHLQRLFIQRLGLPRSGLSEIDVGKIIEAGREIRMATRGMALREFQRQLGCFLGARVISTR